MIFDASACSSEALKVSYVLDALGIDPIWAQGSVVFSLGIDNISDDVKIFLTELPRVVDRLKRMLPLTGAGQIDQFRYRKQ